MTTSTNYLKTKLGRKGDHIYKVTYNNSRVTAFNCKYSHQTRQNILRLPTWSDQLTSLFNVAIFEIDPMAQYLYIPSSFTN
jgi:hypothetical protein